MVKEDYSKLLILISLHTVILYLVFLSNTNNVQEIISWIDLNEISNHIELFHVHNLGNQFNSLFIFTFLCCYFLRYFVDKCMIIKYSYLILIIGTQFYSFQYFLSDPNSYTIIWFQVIISI